MGGNDSLASQGADKDEAGWHTVGGRQASATTAAIFSLQKSLFSWAAENGGRV